MRKMGGPKPACHSRIWRTPVSVSADLAAAMLVFCIRGGHGDSTRHGAYREIFGGLIFADRSNGIVCRLAMSNFVPYVSVPDVSHNIALLPISGNNGGSSTNEGVMGQRGSLGMRGGHNTRILAGLANFGATSAFVI